MAHILIVDDEEDVRFTLAKALRAEGHEIYQASDGNVALKILDEQEIHLVLTDLLMPNREGLETIRGIRMHWPEVKIIAMSGGGRFKNAEFLEVAEKFGADMVMKKPFSMSELKHEVSRILDGALWQTD